MVNPYMLTFPVEEGVRGREEATKASREERSWAKIHPTHGQELQEIKSRREIDCARGTPIAREAKGPLPYKTNGRRRLFECPLHRSWGDEVNLIHPFDAEGTQVF